MVASMNENDTKNLAARESKLAITAGIYLSSFRTIDFEVVVILAYHWNSPQR